jgi:RND family efflux transporter MFP subunit
MRRGSVTVVVVVLMAGIAAFVALHGKSTGQQVSVLRIQPVTVIRTLAVTGQVEAVQRADLSSPISNVQALRVLVDKGQHVTFGQPVIVLDARTLRATALRSHALLLQARAALLQAKAQKEGADRTVRLAALALHDNTDLRNQLNGSIANAASAQAALVIAQQNDRKVRSGARTEAVAAAAAQLASARAQLALARANFARSTSLHSQGALAQSDLDASRAAFLSAQTAVTAAKNQMDELRIPRTEDVVQADASVAEARAAVVAAQKTLATNRTAFRNTTTASQALVRAQANLAAARAAVTGAQASMQAASAQYTVDAVQAGKTVLKAPVTGVVTARSIEPGETVTAGQTLLSFAAPGDMRIRADVDETDLHEIHPGQKVVVAPDAYPSLRLQAQVAEIVPQADDSKGTVEVRVALLKPSALLLPHLTADLNIATGDFQNALALPRAAVLNPDGSAQVCVVTGGRISIRKVSVTSGGEGLIIVKSGLAAGDLVALDPTGLTDNQKVSPVVVKQPAAVTGAGQ